MSGSTKQIVLGVVIGIGISITVVVIAVIAIVLIVGTVYKNMTSEIEEYAYNDEDYIYEEYTPEKNLLEIINETNQKDESGLVVTGVVKNNDDIAWSNIEIELELFDKNGIFVHECSNYISQKISPGQLENFKISCKGCEKNKIPEFESHTIRVVNASSY